ncbi:putative pleiotropic drug resistance protein 7 [Acorus calamus]|uniref:Pleiotropic drug resistance protein 7 n=1 Tax=Acorus calamus TaxID=4465 RepID=A0AAV9EES9_ACOCL|nr:putative pleiotropic drug resistance protein 7 [Acorus calamus]
MDTSEIYRVANLRGSMRRNGSNSAWRNATEDVFSRSSREEDDEEALKWAALEKLPTYDRIRKGMLLGSIGASKEIDVDTLSLQEKSKLLDRLVRVAEEDNEKFLLKLKSRMERVGIDIPTIEVRYENLNIEAEAHVGGRSLPTMFNFALNMLELFFNQLHILPNRKKPIAVLHDVSGIIKPRRMTLVLGPPGSGKTSLLLALAGKLSSDLKVSGRVTYNGHGLNEFVPERTAAYISQHDLHIGEMTVRETLAFSARCQGVGTRYDMLVELSRREKEANIKPDPDIDIFMKSVSLGGQEANVMTDYILKILGLDICADTMVGDEMIRGISGGQRKRVTTGDIKEGPTTILGTMKSNTVAIWVFVTYYVIGFDPSVKRLFRQYFLLLLTNQMASSLFRLVASLGRDMIVANTFGSFAMLILIVLGGFILSREDIKKWWKWGYWISPLAYAQNGIATNEFLGNSWSRILLNTTEPLGVSILKSRGVFPEAKWYWISIGAQAGFIVVFNVCYTLALKYFNALGGSQAVVSEETMKEKHMNRTGNHVRTASGSTRTEGTSNGNQNKRGMVLPFTPLSITFDDIRYSVDMPQEMKSQGIGEDRLMLLKGVSGAFRPGVLTALMGVSGAGKTTLMDVLAGRKTGGYIEGSITISGYPKKQETFARISGYCEQNDIHSPHVTIYESLLFSAWLRLPADVNSTTRKMFIEEVMELVELSTLRDSLVGLPGVDGLSTEQRKRLTIAVELVANPSIIFMDEPTSGLDARAAAIVMRTVRNTVDTGRTVVCTIHQPSIDIFEAFDELFLMKRGGEEIYVGPLGRQSCHLIEYFEITDGYNPATWMLEVTTMAQEEALGVNFVEVYKNSPLFERNKALIKELSQPPPNSSDLYFPTQYSQPMFTQWIAFLFLGVQNASSVQPVVAIERTVFYRERAAGMYSALPYAFGQVAIEVPYIFIQSVVYGVIVYAMIGFEWTAAKFFWYLFYMYFTFLYFTYYGMMAVGITPNHNIAAIVSFAFYTIWNLFSGFLIPRPKIPVWWRWYYWMSPVSWTLYGLVASQFGDITRSMEDGDKETVEKFVRNYFGFKHDFLGVVAAVVVGFTVLFAFIFAISIKIFNFQRR